MSLLAVLRAGIWLQSDVVLSLIFPDSCEDVSVCLHQVSLVLNIVRAWGGWSRCLLVSPGLAARTLLFPG